MELSDEALITAMARGDENALRELHQRYAPYLSAMARRMLKDPDEVQQCVQDAFVKAWDFAVRFDKNKASVKTWLVTIAHRTALNKIRKGKIETIPLENWDAPTPAREHLDTIALRNALEQLPSEDRELIELAFYQGHSHSEVANITQRPLGTVKSRLRQSLKLLKDSLSEGGDA